MNNLDLSHHVILDLLHFGVREFLLCAGARNSPFVVYLDHFKNQLKVYHFFEERSGAFFALGRIAQTQRPVAIITTSGTAAAELLPAAIEATYSNYPLILVTADRPSSYRHTGAPQSIEQLGIYSHYVEAEFDLSVNHLLDRPLLSSLSWKKPLHLNICFNEPLVPTASFDTYQVQLDHQLNQTLNDFEKPSQENSPSNLIHEYSKKFVDFITHHRPLVVLGPIKQNDQKSVCEFLKKCQLPIYAESLSGLRAHSELRPLIIKSGEPFIKKLFENKTFDSIIRLGGVPTFRVWRDLENQFIHIPVFSISDNQYSGLSRPSFHIDGIDQIDHFLPDDFQVLQNQLTLFKEDSSYYKKITLLFDELPRSEPSLIHHLSQLIKEKPVYLGNSLPIREWDLAGTFETEPKALLGNRGANGIDGQISTFLGWSQGFHTSWGIFGDLTSMYDLSAPWIANQLNPVDWRIVIINNLGGQIFKRMFKQSSFINAHQINFSHWAHLWNWDYQRWSSIPQQINLSQRQMIEILPCPKQTDLFWNKYEEIFHR